MTFACKQTFTLLLKNSYLGGPSFMQFLHSPAELFLSKCSVPRSLTHSHQTNRSGMGRKRACSFSWWELGNREVYTHVQTHCFLACQFCIHIIKPLGPPCCHAASYYLGRDVALCPAHTRSAILTPTKRHLSPSGHKKCLCSRYTPSTFLTSSNKRLRQLLKN